MAIPKASEFNRAVLEIAAESGEVLTIRQLGESIPLKLSSLTDEDFQERYPNSGQPIVRNLITFAAGKLKRAGLLDSPGRGKYQINQSGKDYLISDTNEISGAILDKIATRLRETSRSDASAVLEDPNLATGPTTQAEETISESDLHPIEAIALAHKELERSLADDMLDSLKSLSKSPSRFEQVVVNLLEKMGYGQGSPVGRSGDGGIDGIINQDPLGLEKVYVQAKCWQDRQVVDREIRDFSGSLTLKGASKGVFITTSDFSSVAIKTAEEYQGRGQLIRLINGQELARLMIRHGVGVVTETPYVVKKLDENFFSDPDNI